MEESRCSEDDKANAKGKVRVNTAKIAQLVDNKRKHMVRNLSQGQRDKILMSTAKDEVTIKRIFWMPLLSRIRPLKPQ